jgi:hypothetical protein
MTMLTADEGSLLRLMEDVLPAVRVWEQGEEKKRPQIFSLPVVVALMLRQRLDERGTQQAVVRQLAAGQLDRLLPDGKRVRERTISPASGGYAQACQRLPVGTMEKVCDQVLEELGQRIEPEPELELPVLVLDGTGLSLEHRGPLLDKYPCSRNQYGQGHWGMLKLVGLHDVRTGIALRPAWGPMYGEKAVSEQALAQEAVARAPAGSVILGDGNFGIFSFVYAVQQSDRGMVFRLTRRRAQAMGAARLLPQGEIDFCWKPSRGDRSANPGLPSDAEIHGRLIVVSLKGWREPIYLFTTLRQSAEKIVSLYCLRWNIEVDFRTLKDTLRLHHLRGKGPAAVEKELLIAIVAYGLVRTCMALAARRRGLAPRRLSFTQCSGWLNDMLEKLYSPLPALRQQAFDRLLTFMAGAKLPQRQKQRAYPREVWGHRQSFPNRHPAKAAEQKTK